MKVSDIIDFVNSKIEEKYDCKIEYLNGLIHGLMERVNDLEGIIKDINTTKLNKRAAVIRIYQILLNETEVKILDMLIKNELEIIKDKGNFIMIETLEDLRERLKEEL